jgi:ParB/RepB/Spo0J family partition protein
MESSILERPPQRPEVPGQIVKIPLFKLIANPDQPRRSFRPGSIQAMRDSLLEIGQQTAAKVRPLSAGEKAKYTPVEFMVLGGHRRLEGAKLAGLETMDCVVMNATPDEALLVGLVDNEWEGLTWLDKYLAIAKLVNRPGSSTRKVSRQIGISQTSVNNAVKISKLLTPAAIGLIDQTLINPPAGEAGGEQQLFTHGSDYEVTLRIVLALAPLGKPTLVEKALKVVIDKRMTEAQTRKLVVSMKAGHDPAELDQKSKAPSIDSTTVGGFDKLTTGRLPQGHPGQGRGAGSPSEPANTDPPPEQEMGAGEGDQPLTLAEFMDLDLKTKAIRVGKSLVDWGQVILGLIIILGLLLFLFNIFFVWIPQLWHFLRGLF